jgi:sortase A
MNSYPDSGVECAWPRAPVKRHLSWLQLAGAAVLAIAGWQLGHGLWIQAKAWVAQALIARAWSRTLAGESQARAWPWADTWPVAKLSVPRLGLERYVLAGANGAAMAFGPGHATGSALPGLEGNSVIGGHRDTHLAFLRELRIGDELIIERADGAQVRYRAAEAMVLDRRETWVAKQEGPTRLTLITCYPFDALRAGGPQRYVLFAFLS